MMGIRRMPIEMILLIIMHMTLQGYTVSQFALVSGLGIRN